MTVLPQRIHVNRYPLFHEEFILVTTWLSHHLGIYPHNYPTTWDFSISLPHHLRIYVYNYSHHLEFHLRNNSFTEIFASIITLYFSKGFISTATSPLEDFSFNSQFPTLGNFIFIHSFPPKEAPLTTIPSHRRKYHSPLPSHRGIYTQFNHKGLHFYPYHIGIYIRVHITRFHLSQQSLLDLPH